MLVGLFLYNSETAFFIEPYATSIFFVHGEPQAWAKILCLLYQFAADSLFLAARRNKDRRDSVFVERDESFDCSIFFIHIRVAVREVELPHVRDV